MRIALGIFLFALAGVVTMFGVVPLWRGIAEARADIARLQALSDEFAALTQERDALNQAYNAVSNADLAKLEAIAPREPATAEALVDFETAAVQNGMTLEQVDFGSGRSEGAATLMLPAARVAQTLPVTMNLRGTYPALRSFLADLERNVRLIDVSEISFATSDIGPFGVNLKGTIYYRR